MDYLNRLQTIHWSIALAVGFALGLACLFGGTHLWRAWRRYRARQAALKTYRKRAQDSARAARNDKVLISDAEAESTPVTGRVLECSVSTVSLRVADSVNRGTRLSWRPFDAPATFGWATVEVKQASRDGAYWKLVCRFIRTPPWVTRFLVEAPEYVSAAPTSE